MKRILLLLFFLSAHFLTFSQEKEFELQKSKLFKHKTYLKLFSAYTLDENRFFTLRTQYNKTYSRSNKYLLTIYDNDFNVLDEVSMNDSNDQILTSYLHNNKIVIIKKTKKFHKGITSHIYTALISEIDKLNFSSQKIFSISTKNVYEFFHSDYTLNPYEKFDNFVISNNKKFISFYYKLDSKKSGKNIGIINFDENFAKQYAKTIEPEEGFDGGIIQQQLKISDLDGSTYAAVHLLAGKLHFLKSKTGYITELQKIGKGKTLKNILSKHRHSLNTININEYKNTIITTGFYSNSGNLSYIGVFRQDINANDLKTIRFSYKEMPDSFIIDKEGSLEKHKKPFTNNLKIINSYVDEDGSVVVITEENSSGSYDAGSNINIPAGCNDIIVFKFSPNGRLIYASNINKSQKHTYQETHSINSAYAHKNIFLFVNVKNKVKKLSNNRIKLNSTSHAIASSLFLLKLDANGKFSMVKLVDQKDIKVPFNVMQRQYLHYPDDILLLGSHRSNNKAQLLRVKLK